MAKKAKPTLINSAIVLVGTGLSPNSFTADMLIEKGIVPTGWKVVGNLNSNVLSQIAFQGGRYIFKVERNKVTIADNVVGGTYNPSVISDIAKRFLAIQKHLTFTAIGINFMTISKDIKGGAEYIRKNFLLPDKQVAGKYPLAGASVICGFDIENGLLSVTISEGAADIEKPDSSERLEGIVASANFHRDIEAADASTVKEILDGAASDWKMLTEIVEDLI